MEGYLRVVSRNPFIVVRDHLLADAVDASLPDRPVCHWVLVPQAQVAERILDFEAARRQRRPQDTAVYFCTDLRVYRQLMNNPAVQVSWAALESFVNERMFDGSTPSIEPEFDAILVTRSVPWKRSELACKVPRLLVVMPHVEIGTASENYIRELRQLMKDNATFLLDDNKPIPRIELASHLKRARVGLTLSAHEGVNRVCYEYQLAGLPVVTTASEGGRTQFLDPDTSMTVPAEPDAIAAAVRELCDRKLDPREVRERVMEKIRAHRQEIIRLGQRIWTQSGRHHDFARHIYQLTEAKPLVFRENVDQRLSELNR